MTELGRFHANVLGEMPSEVPLIIIVYCECPSGTLLKVRSVQETVLIASSAEHWPDDDWWSAELPEWFLSTFRYSIEEIAKNASLWDFGSWIDACKYRGWEWWSTSCCDNSCKITLRAEEDPFVIGPLEYLITSAGGTSLELLTPGRGQ